MSALFQHIKNMHNLIGMLTCKEDLLTSRPLLSLTRNWLIVFANIIAGLFR